MKRKLMGFVAVMLSMFLLFGAVETSAATETVNGATVYKAEYPDNLLGMAADFGVFADTVDLSGDLESNVACNNLVQYRDMTATANGYFYAKKFVPAGTIGSEDKYRAIFDTVTGIDVYVGSWYGLRKEADGSWFISENGREYGRKVSKSGSAQRIEFHNEDSTIPFIDIASELANLTKTATDLQAKPAAGAVYDGSNENSRKIKVSEKESVLNLTYDELVNRMSNQWASWTNTTPLYITGLKDTGNNLIINVCGIPSDVKTITVKQIYIDGKDPETNARYTQQLLWNFGSFSGEVVIDGFFGGTVLAPAAKVNLQSGPLLGSVIAKEFKNGAEVHFIPNKIKKIEEPSEVTITIEAVDGTCCPSVALPGEIKATLYKQGDDGKYRKYGSENTKKTAGGFATWTIDEAGSYYISEKESTDGFAKTPIKCFFTVEKDADGILRIKPIDKPSEANGQSKTFEYINDTEAKNAGYFKLRHYSNSMYVAAIEMQNNMLALVTSQYHFEVKKLATGETLNTFAARNLAEAYDMLETNITEAGSYQVELYKGAELAETKYVDVYYSPVGIPFFVEKDNAELAQLYESYLGSKFVMTKLSSKNQKGIKQLEKDYPDDFGEMTDGCLFFDVTAD